MRQAAGAAAAAGSLQEFMGTGCWQALRPVMPGAAVSPGGLAELLRSEGYVRVYRALLRQPLSDPFEFLDRFWTVPGQDVVVVVGTSFAH